MVEIIFKQEGYTGYSFFWRKRVEGEERVKWITWNEDTEEE
jgi:hypothetical protein